MEEQNVRKELPQGMGQHIKSLWHREASRIWGAQIVDNDQAGETGTDQVMWHLDFN